MNAPRPSLTARILKVSVIGLGLIDFLRGAIHWLAPDSGAGVIAGMNLSNASGPDLIFLLATDGIGQIAWGVVYCWVALRKPQYLLGVIGLEGAKGAMLLFTEFVTKPPVHPVPGRFMHMFSLVLALTLLGLSAQERRAGTRPSAEADEDEP